MAQKLLQEYQSLQFFLDQVDYEQADKALRNDIEGACDRLDLLDNLVLLKEVPHCGCFPLY